EFELLRDLGKTLGVQLELIVVNDIEKAFDYLESGKVDVIAMNLDVHQNPRQGRAAFTNYLGTRSTVIVGKNRSGKQIDWTDLTADTVYVRKGTAYLAQLAMLKDSLDLEFTVLEAEDHEE